MNHGGVGAVLMDILRKISPPERVYESVEEFDLDPLPDRFVQNESRKRVEPAIPDVHIPAPH